MKTILCVCITLVLGANVQAQWSWDTFKKKAKDAIENPNSSSLTNDEIINGLREALNVGAGNATQQASQLNGFLKNPAIKIPFPPEVQKVEATLRKLGMGKKVDEFVESMNHAAENASQKAKPIFIDAIKGITIKDGLSILNGGETAATTYLSGRTSNALEKAFLPDIEAALQQTATTALWKDLINLYNRIPTVRTKLNPNLNEYVTEKAVSGIFHLVGEEERKIRKDPSARITEILKKVFK